MMIKHFKPFDIFNMLLLALVGFITLYPFIYTMSISISSSEAVVSGKVLLLPVKINLLAYKQVLRYPQIWIAYKNTVIYTVVGTLFRVVLLMITAYPLSRTKFPGRTMFTFFIGFTMLFSGGMIPVFLVVRACGLLNTLWAMVIPGALGAYLIIIVRTFFQTTIPNSLVESAELDGANDLQILLRIVLPLSKPVIAVMSLFIAVGIWNSYFQALIYLTDLKLQPLTIILRNIVVRAKGDLFHGIAQLGYLSAPSQSVQSATLIVSIIPVLILYPFVQKYFVKGIMIGAIKG